MPETIAPFRSRQAPSYQVRSYQVAPQCAAIFDRTVLTKRRAVDFCRVTTAICCPPVFQPAA